MKRRRLLINMRTLVEGRRAVAGSSITRPVKYEINTKPTIPRKKKTTDKSLNPNGRVGRTKNKKAAKAAGLI